MNRYSVHIDIDAESSDELKDAFLRAFGDRDYFIHEVTAMQPVEREEESAHVGRFDW